MVFPVEAAGEKDVDQPSIARVRDYWLGGSHHTERDRKFADHAMICAPQLPYLVRGQRAMVRRMVKYLVRRDVRQFIDLGSGIPTGNYVHEVAQDAEPESRVLYVDIDPDIVRDSRELLADNAHTMFLQADIRRPDRVLESPELQGLLDLGEPVAVLIIETLSHIPDPNDPAVLVAAYKDAICSGSYLGISHFSENEQLLAAFDLFDQMGFGTRPLVHLRDPEKLAVFFAGLELVEPGVVPIFLWHPASADDIGHDPELCQMHVGLGRKP